MTGVINETLTIEKSDENFLHSIMKAQSSPSCTTRIPRVPMVLKENLHHDKYYIPKVVSLGPYHHGKQDLESVECFKPFYTNRLLNGNQESIHDLYHNLANIVQTLREYYEDDVDHLSDDEFTRMMLLDGCFIMYIIQHMSLDANCLALKSYHIMFVQQDILLLENQIPYQVLAEVMKFAQDKNWDSKIKEFVDGNIFAEGSCRVNSKMKALNPQVNDPIPTDITHLLELLQTRLTKERSAGPLPKDRYTFRNVNELKEVGINFKPSKKRSLSHIKFSKCGFFANLELPPITVDDSTKPMLLNLVAYEICSNDTNASWITSYICLLDSLIDHCEDVRVLRKAGILDNRLGSDEEVAQLFNEIGRDLVSNTFAFSEAGYEIQKHYDSKRNTWISQLRREYIKTPWAFVALLVGLVGLFLSSVQAYFSVFGNQSHCDSFCLYLKRHHQPP